MQKKVDPIANLKETLKQFSRKLKKGKVGLLRGLLDQAAKQYKKALPALEKDRTQQGQAHESIRNSFEKDRTEGWFKFRSFLPEARGRLMQAIYASANRERVKKGLRLANELSRWQEASRCSLRLIIWHQPGKDTPEWTTPLVLRPLPRDHQTGLEQDGPVPLADLYLRHATTIRGLLDMLTATAKSDPPQLHFEGAYSPAQYRGAKLAWFGLALPDRYQHPMEAVQERYGTVLVTIPCEVLLRAHQRHLWLGWREYKQELSQTVLVVDDDNYASNDGWIFSSPFEQGMGYSLAEVEPKAHWPSTYRPGQWTARWVHSEFAVLNGLTLSPADRVRVAFQNHTAFCVKYNTGRPCRDCDEMTRGGVTAANARDYFAKLVCENNLGGALYQFHKAFRAFDSDEWDALEQAIPQLRQAKYEDDEKNEDEENEDEDDEENENEKIGGVICSESEIEELERMEREIMSMENEHEGDEHEHEHEHKENEPVGSVIVSESEIKDLELVERMEREAIMKNKHEGDEHKHKHKHEHEYKEKVGSVIVSESEIKDLELVERMEREAIMIMKSRIDEELRMRDESEHDRGRDNLPLPLASGVRSQLRKRSPQQLTEAAAETPAPLHPPQHKRESPTKKHRPDSP